MVRNSETKLLQAHAQFESLAEMVNCACNPQKPTLVKSLGKNRIKLDDAYQEVFFLFKSYKSDVNDKDFNGVNETGDPVYKLNDGWFTALKNEYYDIVDRSDEKLESLETPPTPKANDEAKVGLMEDANVVKSTKLKGLLSTQLENEKRGVEVSIKNILDKLSQISTGSLGVNQAQGFRLSLQDVNMRLDNRLQKLAEDILNVLDENEAVNFNAEFVKFISDQKVRISTIELDLVSKIKEPDLPMSLSTASRSSPAHTYLKKQDPPTFSGDILDFPEFKRRWASQVHSERLEEQAELDRLRDNIPETAKRMLTGEKTLLNAWNILTKLYGNKTMLANMLKGKLKEIKLSGREDHDIVINLAIEVKSIVKSLTEMGMTDMLRFDDEYLSAIFKVLPTPHRNKWLELDKSSYCTRESNEVGGPTKLGGSKQIEQTGEIREDRNNYAKETLSHTV